MYPGSLSYIPSATSLRTHCHGPSSAHRSRASTSHRRPSRLHALSLTASISTPPSSRLYAIPDVITEQFDIVYTGVGAINWLPDIDGWAKVMAHLTKPAGRFYMREGHPVVWALDYERDDDLLVISEPYFETEDPGTWDAPTSYTGSGTLDHTTTHEWNHGLGEVINALIKAGLRIELVEEHRFLDWPALPQMVRVGERYEMPPHLKDHVPLMYSILAVKAG